MNQIKKTSFNNLPLILLSFALIIFFISDGIYKIEVRGGLSSFRIGVIVKGIFTLIFFFYAIIYLSKEKNHLLFSIFILGAFFFIGQFLLVQNMTSLKISENLNRFFKYIFILLLYMPASDILVSKKCPYILLKLYKFIIWFNGIVILIAFLFSIDMFRTYIGPWRFGFDGLIYAQNEASYFFILALTTFYYRRFYLHIKEWTFWLVLITSLLVGTKAVLLYIILLLLFHISQRVSIKKILIAVSSIAIIGYFVFSSTINKILLNAWQIFQYNYEKEGLLFALLSGRNTFINTKLLPLIGEKWTWLNFLIGGQDVQKYYIEMGFFDLFLFFGLIGMLLYLYIFIKIYNRITFEYKFKLFFLLALSGIIGLSGHFFTSSIAAMYFIVFILINHYYHPKSYVE